MDNKCCGIFVGGHTSDKNCSLVEANKKIDRMLKVLIRANEYNADHTKFTPCMEIDYYNMVRDILYDFNVEPTNG